MEVTTEIKLLHQKEFKDIFFQIKWHTVFQVAAIYIFGVIGLYQLITGQWKFLTFLWSELIYTRARHYRKNRKNCNIL